MTSEIRTLNNDISVPSNLVVISKSDIEGLYTVTDNVSFTAVLPQDIAVSWFRRERELADQPIPCETIVAAALRKLEEVKHSEEGIQGDLFRHAGIVI